MSKKTEQDVFKKLNIISDDDQITIMEKECDRHIISSLGHDYNRPNTGHFYQGLAYTIRDRMIEKWLGTQRKFYTQKNIKRVYYLSLEFLPGPFLKNNIINMGLEENARKLCEKKGLDFDEVVAEEPEPGLGNGGLGRLASCYLDSSATSEIPIYGYGMRYAYGIFKQTFNEKGDQVEAADNWLRRGNAWEFERPNYMYDIHFYGRVEKWVDKKKCLRVKWVDTEVVRAMPCDTMISGHKTDFVGLMRLWAARASSKFNLDFFNEGQYIKSVEEKIGSEKISMVLYPNDKSDEGKILRLKQQYFFVSATMQDILRRFKKEKVAWSEFSKKVAIHLNETHPAIAIPELMRILIDEEMLDWDKAWKVCQNTFAYTNHTVLPEALEIWSVALIEQLLPRHMEIIYEINTRFLKEIHEKHPEHIPYISDMSLIGEGDVKTVRMANLAIVCSHTVNGVAALHSELIQKKIFYAFNKLYPKKFTNVTNGINPRRFLLQANPDLANLITEKIGDGWTLKLSELEKLIPFADQSPFITKWNKIREKNKKKLASFIYDRYKIKIPVDGIVDVQVKRIHEYKRQLLNIFHVIHLYHKVKEDPKFKLTPRTVIFGGKAAPGYCMAKLIIRLINSVAKVVNNDPDIKGRLKVVYIENYNVTVTETIIPATDLSEQISTAGMEASGTGNMKFALNGAMTIGTFDGANIEIIEEVGEENFFLFGLKEEDVAKNRGQNLANSHYDSSPDLRRVIESVQSGFFNKEEPGLFHDIVSNLFTSNDYFMNLADFDDYIRTQGKVEKLFADKKDWARRSILNTAKMGKFSSDRSIMEYATRIWKVKQVK